MFHEGRPVRAPGDIGSANADMSNDKHCERQCRRKSKGFLRKVNLRRVSRSPKARPKGVVDGNHVNIRGPEEGDGWDKLWGITGFSLPRTCSRK